MIWWLLSLLLLCSISLHELLWWGQCVMCATVIMSSFGSPPHLLGDGLGEGSPSLNPHLIHWLVHQSCSIQMVGHQW